MAQASHSISIDVPYDMTVGDLLDVLVAPGMRIPRDAQFGVSVHPGDRGETETRIMLLWTQETGN
jgi:hypothetical protein